MVRAAAGQRRVKVLMAALAAAVALGLAGCSVPPPYEDLVVNTTLDGGDADPGDGVCEITTGEGDCSLRAAIDEGNTRLGNVPPRIVVPAATYRLTETGTDDTNAGGDLDVRPVGGRIVIAAAAPGAVVDAAGAESGFDMHTGLIVAQNLTVTAADGPAVRTRASLTRLEQVSAHGNDGPGLLVESGGTAVTYHTTFTANSPGVANDGTYISVLTTVAGNAGGGLAGSGSTVLAGTVVADQTSGPDCSAAVSSNGYNLDSDGSCALTGTQDLSLTDPQLRPLDGDPLPGHLPDPASPLVDRIPPGTGGLCDASVTTDQWGTPRPHGTGCDPGAVESTNQLIVDNPTDERDDTPGDGRCDIDGPPVEPGDCTLRAAIDETNADTDAAMQIVTLSVDPILDRAGAIDDTNATGDLDTTANLTIEGDGHTIDADGLARVLHQLDGNLTLREVTLTGGHATFGDSPTTSTTAPVTTPPTTTPGGDGSGNGGAILSNQGRLVIEQSTLQGNVAANSGGGLYQEDGVTIVRASTFEGNDAGNDGGAVHVNGGSFLLETSTIAGNTTTDAGGGISSAGTTTVSASTITGNTGPVGSAIRRSSGSSRVRGSVLAGPGADCSGSLISDGHNLDSDATCGLSHVSDLVSANPELEPLADNGGPTRTRLPQTGSPLVDAIPIGTPLLCESEATDQRGIERPTGDSCDVGSVEGDTPASVPPLELTVDTAADSVDAAPGDGLCADSGGACSLRAAVLESNLRPTTDVVTISAGIDPTLSRGGSSEELGLLGDLDVHDALVIRADGATIDGGGIDRIFHLHDGGLAILDATLTGGVETTLPGGAIRTERGTLALTDSRVEGNAAAWGGGISVNGGVAVISTSTISDNTASDDAGGLQQAGGTTVIDRSTISGNTAADDGGGVNKGAGTLVVTNSTLSGNSAVDGGGIRTSGTTSIVSSTIADNLAPNGSAVARSGGSLTIAGSILTGAGADCVGTIGSAGYNLDTDATCGFDGATDLPARDDRLAPLTDNGGGTDTHLPAADSEAVDAIPTGTPGLCDGSTTGDQRGLSRPVGPACDIGAVEGSGPTIPPASFLVDTASDAIDVLPGDGLCETAGGACSLRAAITEANQADTSDLISIAPGIDPTLALAGTGDDANATGDLDITDHVVIEGGGATIDASSLDRAIHLLDDSLDLRSVTLTGGVAAGGGGLRMERGGVHLTSVSVTANRTNGSGMDGGGIFQASGQLLIETTTVESNEGNDEGGGIYSAAGHLTLDDAVVQDNTALRRGGGIRSAGGLTVEASTISGNRLTSSTATGGGVMHTGPTGRVESSRITTNTLTGSSSHGGGLHTAGTFAIDTTTIDGNQAGNRGGGLYTTSTTGLLTMHSSTVAGNQSRHGAGVWAAGTLTAQNVTVSGNTATETGGGWYLAGSDQRLTAVTTVGNHAPGAPAIAASAGALTLQGSIVSSTGADCTGALTSGGYNLGSDDSCGFTQSSDQTGLNLLLGGLAPNGGPTETHQPFVGSPAVDAIPAGTAALCDETALVDQRILPRPVGAACDIGAVEGDSGVVATPLALVVDSPADAADAHPADGACDTGDGSCTLRAAIDEANAWPVPDVISVAPGVDPVLSIAGGQENLNATGDLDVTDAVTILGGGAQVDGGGLDRLLHVLDGSLEIEDLALTGGQSDGGGAIRQERGELTVRGSTLAQNEATAGSATGGAILLVDGELTLEDSHLSDNVAGRGGALSVQAGTATLTTSHLDGNTGLFGSGGGLNQTGGTVAIGESTVSANTATTGGTGAHGGGIYQDGGSLAISRSAVWENTSVGHGGGILQASGELAVSDTTVSGNTAAARGGGISTGGTATLRAVTSVDNIASEGAALAVQAGVTSTQASIFAGPGVDCTGTVTSLGYNLDSDASCTLTSDTDLRGENPLLSALGDHGGPTLSSPPFAGSPVVDAIPPGTAAICDGSATMDQRGQPRPAGAGCDIGAAEGAETAPPPLDLEVDSAADGSDLVPGDGSCDTGTGVCTLRAAVDEANASRTTGTITFAPGVDPVIGVGGADDSNAQGDLDVSGHVRIEGPGATVDGNDLDRVLDLRDGSLEVTGLTITNGRAYDGAGVRVRGGRFQTDDAVLSHGSVSGSGYGAGLAVTDGLVVVEGSTIAHNTATTGAGVHQSGGEVRIEGSTVRENSSANSSGGIAQTGGTLTISRSLLANNTTTTGAGGLGLFAGTAIVTDSTIAGNSTTGYERSGAILSRGQLTVRSSTIVGNIGGSIHRKEGEVTLIATIVDGSGSDCTAPVTSLGFNLDGDSTCGLDQPTDRPGQPSLLAPLTDNGGPTATRLPLADSPAVDAIPAGAPGDICVPGASVDQRGVPRPEGAACDIGAVEGTTGEVSVPLTLVVDTAADGTDLLPGDGACATGAGGCSLRAAIDESNASPTYDTISIAPGVDPVLTIAGHDEDRNEIGDLDILDPVHIDGGGQVVTAVDTGDRVIHTVDGPASIVDLTISGGFLGGNRDGGGINHQHGVLDLHAVEIVGNHSYNGGGIYLAGGSLVMTRSRIESNSSSQGGGLYLFKGTASIVDTTLWSNEARFYGGAIYQAFGTSLLLETSTIADNLLTDGEGAGLFVTGAEAVIRQSTITLNSAPTPFAGGIHSDGTVTVEASTLADNLGPSLSTGTGTLTVRGSIVEAAGPDCAGTIDSGGHNLDSDGSCDFSQVSDLPSAEPLLGPPVDNGGPTSTRLPFANSPALDAIPPGTPGVCDASAASDQRGLTRPAGPGCDLGAVEGHSGSTASPLALTVTSAGDEGDALAGDGVCATTVETCTLRAAVDESNLWPTADAVTIAPGIDPTLAIPGAKDNANRTGDLDIWGDLVLTGNGSTITAGFSSSDRDRAVHVLEGPVELFDLTVTGGYGRDHGGAIRVDGADLLAERLHLIGNQSTDNGGGIHMEGGALVLVDSTITANVAENGGGLSMAAASVEIDRSTIAGNTSSGGGGGIAQWSGDLTISRSTISHNDAGGLGARGGALYSQGGTATIRNTSISGNTAYASGGGLYGSSVTIVYSTITGNSAPTAPGIHAPSGSMTLGASLLDNGTGSCAGTITSLGWNASADASCGLMASGDLQSVALLLGALGDNGGPTETLLPGPGSPAIDAIPAGTPTFCDGTTVEDQRGVSRPTGAGCDRGAVEQ